MPHPTFEIIVITYNRCLALRKTLAAIYPAKNVFRSVTVLDNCSTDQTQSIIQEFPEFRSIRHRFNIGLGANYLRAVEISQSDYTWILCDDDDLDLDGIADVLQVMESSNPDLLVLGGAPNRFSSFAGQVTNISNLIPHLYFTTLSFVPSFAFKTSLFDSNSVFRGYTSPYLHYPHFAFLVAQAMRNSSVYIAQKQYVRRNLAPTYFDALAWMEVWVQNCREIPDSTMRHFALLDASEGKIPFFPFLLITLIKARGRNAPHYFRSLMTILGSLNGPQKWGLICLFPFLLLPSFFWRTVRGLYQKIKNLGRKNVVSNDVALTSDMFRS